MTAKAGNAKLLIPLSGSKWYSRDNVKYEVLDITNLHMAENSEFVPTVICAPCDVPEVRISMALAQWHQLMQPALACDIEPVVPSEFDWDRRFETLQAELHGYIYTVAKFYDIRRRADLHNLCNAMLTHIGTVNGVAIQLATAEAEADKARLRLELTSELTDVMRFVKTYKSTIKPLDILANGKSN